MIFLSLGMFTGWILCQRNCTTLPGELSSRVKFNSWKNDAHLKERQHKAAWARGSQNEMSDVDRWKFESWNTAIFATQDGQPFFFHFSCSGLISWLLLMFGFFSSSFLHPLLMVWLYYCTLHSVEPTLTQLHAHMHFIYKKKTFRQRQVLM